MSRCIDAIAGALALALACMVALDLPRGVAMAAQADSTRSHAIDEPAALATNDSIPVAPEIVVTAPRWGLPHREMAASVAVVDAQDLAASAALTVDDALRQVPGFSLFRRAGSRTANPTTQGVSLRGLGGSGASRALVLVDGIPLNDPFGGWVAWPRLHGAWIDRIEVSRGGGSDLYGNTALGGVIHVIPRWSSTAGDSRIAFEGAYGSQGTHDVEAHAFGSAGKWGGAVAAQSFETDGYVVVAPESRGEIDVPARSRSTALVARVERRFSRGWRAHAAYDAFEEARGNGTPFQENGTQLDQLSIGASGRTLGGDVVARAYVLEQRYHQTFSAIEAGRSAERPTRSQNVPAGARGGSIEWSGGSTERHHFVIGSDVRDLRGTNEETALPSGAFESVSGRQLLGSAFAAGRVSVATRLWIAAGARLDAWENFDAAHDDGDTVEILAGQSDDAVSPQASLLYEASDEVALWAAAYRGFRAPTLNELYRSFRVGDVVTLANERLEAERSTGTEIGVKTAPSARIQADATLFWMNVERTIANVTIESSPDLITRQRQNLGEIRSRGIEVDLHARFGPCVASAGYLYADALVIDFPADPSLEGRRLPQTPAHQLTAQCRVADSAGRTASVQARWIGEQFDDDQSRFRLAPFFALDALASLPVAQGVSLFAAVENVFDQQYEVGRTPTLTIGAPRAVRAGLELHR